MRKRGCLREWDGVRVGCIVFEVGRRVYLVSFGYFGYGVGLREIRGGFGSGGGCSFFFVCRVLL